MKLKRLFRSPLLHFLLLGAALFGAQLLRAPSPESDEASSRRITIEADQVVELQSTFRTQMGRGPDEAEVARMIEAEAQEEILYREALERGLLERDGGVQTRLIQKMLFLEGGSQIEEAPKLLARAVELGLHHEDVVVRRILVQKMKLFGSSLQPDQAVTEDDLTQAYREGTESLRAPDRLSLVHVFLSSDRRGTDVERDALDLRDRLVSNAVPQETAPAAADPFPLGHHLERRSQHDLERTFGARFGEAVFALDPDTWSGPIASAYGLHLVRVMSREAGEVPPLEIVSDRLRLQIEETRRDANLTSLLEDLRARYEVVVAPSPSTTRPTPGANSTPAPSLETAQEPG